MMTETETETETETVEAPVDPGHDFETIEINDIYEKCWYENVGSGRYWAEVKPAVWIAKSETQMRRWLVGQGVQPFISDEQKKQGQVQSELEDMLKKIESFRHVAWSGILAGMRAGVHRMRGSRVLVTETAQLIEPKAPPETAAEYWPTDDARPCDDMIGGAKGWATLSHFWRNLLSCDRPGGVDNPDKETYDQRHFWLAWLQRAMVSLYACDPLRGHALLIAGEPGCGKSLNADIVAELMGGRVARPLRWIFGLTQFNSDMFPAPLLLIDDEGAKTHIADRKELAAKVKQIVAVKGGAMEGKLKNAIELVSFKRLMMMTNLEEQNLLVFPPIDDDIRDKVMLFKAYQEPFPWGPNLMEEAIWGRLSAEFPYFLHWLLNDYVVPETIRSQRFGVAEWLHPEILAGIDFLSPEMRLLGWIERVILTKAHEWEGVPLPAGVWRGSALDIETALKAGDNGLTFKERDKVPSANPTIGKFLCALSQKPNLKGRVTQRRTATFRGWEIWSEEALEIKRHSEASKAPKTDTYRQNDL